MSKSNKGKREQLGNLMVSSGEDTIRAAALKLKDHKMLSILGGECLIAKELKFHHSCRKAYTNRAARMHDADAISEHGSMTAYGTIREYVKRHLVDNVGAEKLQSLYKMYTESLNEEDPTSSAQRLCETLMQDFHASLTISKFSNKQGVIIHNRVLTSDEACKRVNFDNNGLTEAAHYLRIVILGARKEDDDSERKLESLQKGEVKPLNELLEFFRVLYTGKSTTPNTDQMERLIQSVVDDVMYNASHGRLKQSKHLCLALTIKSLIGSRKIIEILNRFGHCVGYHYTEQLETELATTISDRTHTTPDGITRRPGLCTSLAFDNYDEQTETLSGHGTLHDTVGICYQNVLEDNDVTMTSDAEDCPQRKVPSPRRSFEFEEKQLESYRKRPRISDFNYQTTQAPEPEHLTLVQQRDLFWVMNLALGHKIPMWTGWNGLFTPDPLPKQKICYMQNISLPPTRLDVVAETLKQTQNVAEECGERTVVVHYDLAIAKVALQINASESPRYDNVLICFGHFHIILAYFACLGHYVDGSGGAEILTETDVLAGGSVNGFLNGKHYNR